MFDNEMGLDLFEIVFVSLFWITGRLYRISLKFFFSFCIEHYKIPLLMAKGKFLREFFLSIVFSWDISEVINV